MDDALRRLVAFVAGVATEGQQAEGIFDFEIGSRFPIAGIVDGGSVEVIDQTDGVRLIGALPELRHADGIVELHLLDDEFTGLDHAANARFDGRVSGRNIDLNDHATGVTHIYCL